MISCCDPGKLPRTDALVDPNRKKLVNGQWKGLDIKHPSIVMPVTEGATLYAVPGSRKTAITLTQAEYYPSRGGYLFLHAPGPWYLYNDSGSDQEVVILDAYNAIGLLFFAGIRIIGSGGAADVRNADADADFAAALRGLVTNSRLSVYDPVNAADWLRLLGLTGATVEGTGRLTTASAGGVPLTAIVGMTGRDLTGGGNGVSRQVEARALSGFLGAATSLQGLLASSVQMGISATTLLAAGILAETSALNTGGLASLQMRASGYWGGLKARRYTLTHALPTTQFQAEVGFVATAPAILIVNAATNELIVRRITLSALQAITAASLHCAVMVDPDNRYSSGGTSFIPTGGFKSTNRDGTAGTAYTPTQAVYFNGVTAIVATAADNDEYQKGAMDFTDDEGNVEFVFDDDVIVPPSGSLLIYVWSIGGGEDFGCSIDCEVANVQ